MERLQKEEGIHFFRLAGSNPPWKFLVSIAHEIQRRRIRVFYSAFASMNNISASDLPVLSKSGLRALFFGIESGDSAFLKRVHNKNNVGPDHIVEVVQAAMKEGIFSCLSFIIPSPFETEGTRDASFRLIERCFDQDRLGSVLVLPSTLSPGTAWWNRKEDYGFALKPGTDKESYFVRMLDWDSSILLPRTSMQDLGFTLNGKECVELFQESETFRRRVASLGISTNGDDASYMIGLMGRMSGQEYLAEITQALVLGGAERLNSLVKRINSTEGSLPSATPESMLVAPQTP